MTIWIEKFKKELEDHLAFLWRKATYSSTDFSIYQNTLRHYTKAFPSAFSGWRRCSIFGDFVPPSEMMEYYLSWECFIDGRSTYAAKVYDGLYIGRDAINNIPIALTNLVQVSLQDGGIKYTCKTFARDKVGKEEWILDKKDKVYKDYMFDYDAFSKTYKGSPRFWKNPKTEECYGIELELKFASYDHKLAFAQDIKDKHKPWICEKDGSLDNGSPNGPSLELIGPPLSLQRLNDDIGNICELMKKHEVQPLSKHYALHITTNINNAGNPTLAGARYIALINHPEYRNFWIQAAGRKDSYNVNTGKSYAAWMDIPDNITDLMSNNLWVPRWSSHPVDHYYATFLRKGAKGIETRIFKSQNKESTINYILLLNKLAWNFAKSDVPIECWITFISSQDRNLTKFLQHRKCF